jgi:hypothetical protein
VSHFPQSKVTGEVSHCCYDEKAALLIHLIATPAPIGNVATRNYNPASVITSPIPKKGELVSIQQGVYSTCLRLIISTNV